MRRERINKKVSCWFRLFAEEERMRYLYLFIYLCHTLCNGFWPNKRESTQATMANHQKKDI